MASKLRALLSFHEGRIRHVYPDSLGYLTIGVGHLVDKRLGGGLPEHIIDALLDWDIAEHKKLLDAALPWAARMGDARYAALQDMTFNLGIEPFDGDGFKDWPVFVNQLKTGQYAAAAANMRHTLWVQQVGQRAIRLAAMIETNTWPTDVPLLKETT